MAAGSTYTPIETYTVPSAAASVTFNSFSGYTDLVVVCTVQSSSGGDLSVQFNGDTNTNYSYKVMYGNGTAGGNTNATNRNFIPLDYYAAPPTSGSFNNEILQIQNYSNSTTYKTVLNRANNAATGVDFAIGLWRNTAAITSMTFKIVTPTGNINTGSTFTLYGILAA